MAIDWTKPIQHHSGTEAIVLPDRDGEDTVAVAFRVDYSQGWVLWNIPKQDAEQYFRNVPTTATEQAQPEIDWAGEVQYRCPSSDEWKDIQIIGGPVNGCVWSCHANGKPKTLLIEAYYFRNKPAEPKPVQAILKLWRSALDHTLVISAYLKNDFVTVESIRRGHPEDAGKLLSVVEIDLHEGEGLEGEK